jgi:hypothetical protein
MNTETITGHPEEVKLNSAARTKGRKEGRKNRSRNRQPGKNRTEQPVQDSQERLAMT